MSKKKFFLGSVALLIIASALVWGKNVWAVNDVSNFFLGIFELFAMWIIDIVGSLLLLAIDLLIGIAQFGDFLNTPIVDKGWVVIRDVCYVVIIILFLWMAFATAFGKSDYQISTMLPKLFIAAVMIHFSKMISGLIIDLGQVVMIFFVNQFKDIAAGNITYGFGIHDMMAFRRTASQAGINLNSAYGVTNSVGLGEGNGSTSILGGMILAVLMVIIATIVVFSLVVMMLARIFILWMLVMLSPLAFMGTVVPSGAASAGGGSFSFQDWWKNIWKWNLTGPAIAFMLWLTLAITNEMTTEKRIMNLNFQSQTNQGNTQNSAEWAAFANQVSSTQNVSDYLVTTALFIATLVMASKTGIAGAGIAKAGLDRLNKIKDGAIKKAKAAPWGATKSLTRNTLGRYLSRVAPNSLAGRYAQDRLNAAKNKREKKMYERLKGMGAGERTMDALSKWGSVDSRAQKMIDNGRLQRMLGIDGTVWSHMSDEEKKKLAKERVGTGYFRPASLVGAAASKDADERKKAKRNSRVAAITRELKSNGTYSSCFDANGGFLNDTQKGIFDAAVLAEYARRFPGE